VGVRRFSGMGAVGKLPPRAERAATRTGMARHAATQLVETRREAEAALVGASGHRCAGGLTPVYSAPEVIAVRSVVMVPHAVLHIIAAGSPTSSNKIVWHLDGDEAVQDMQIAQLTRYATYLFSLGRTGALTSAAAALEELGLRMGPASSRSQSMIEPVDIMYTMVRGRRLLRGHAEA
jgi:hypothetical protein